MSNAQICLLAGESQAHEDIREEGIEFAVMYMQTVVSRRYVSLFYRAYLDTVERYLIGRYL